MKEKLTLTVEQSAIRDAKEFARQSGTSLSQMVEKQFQQLRRPLFTEQWYGKFGGPKPDPKDPRLIRLLKKYVHD